MVSAGAPPRLRSGAHSAPQTPQLNLEEKERVGKDLGEMEGTEKGRKMGRKDSGKGGGSEVGKELRGKEKMEG